MKKKFHPVTEYRMVSSRFTIPPHVSFTTEYLVRDPKTPNVNYCT